MTGPAARLSRILAEERAALLDGDYPALEPLAARKIALLEEIEAAKGAFPATLADDLARNARLIGAALSGLREGTARARALRTAQAGFSTYGRDGRARPVCATRPETPRRA